MSTETGLSLDEQVAAEIMERDGGYIAPYSKWRDDVWPVVEEMKRRGWRLFDLGERSEANGEEWFCRFNTDSGASAAAFSDTARKAICLAALAAVRGEKEKQT